MPVAGGFERLPIRRGGKLGKQLAGRILSELQDLGLPREHDASTNVLLDVL